MGYQDQTAQFSTYLPTFPRIVLSLFWASQCTSKKGKMFSNFAEIYVEGRRSVNAETL
ncbi:protein of unknown function [Nitrospira defluvii]|uniref:Uncharacterized protein n=1 Tax=Nitrospira defluvii TaxID=330214 RepID=D8P841_9BACT|nr:protein of unknown function [Nitrospira defluvii]